MQPIDPSNAHLEDRAIELRVLKSALVVFFVALAAVFYAWQIVFAVFVLGYAVYKFRYYRNRVGIYTDEEVSIRHMRLEFGLLAFGAVAAVTFLAIETVFSESWELGGFLSLPAIDFMDFDALVEEPVTLLAWIVVVAPAVAISYVGMQLRQRLLIGLDSSRAVIRATIWDGFVNAPVFLLWLAVLNMRPVYEVWEPVAETVEDALGLTIETADGFTPILGDTFTPVLVVGFAAPVVATGSYLAVQRWKYQDGRIPEILGYRGASPATLEVHNANVVVPLAVYALYALAILRSVESIPVGETQLLAAVALSVVVGANVMATTSTYVRSFSERVADEFDSVTVGLVCGLFVLGASGFVIDGDATVSELALTYLVVAIPLTYAGNYVAGKQAVKNISEFVARIEGEPDEFDQQHASRLFVYSRARDTDVRTAAIDGLATSVRTSTYRKDDALDVFVASIESEEEQIVQSGLRGLATILSYDRSPETHEQLMDAGVRESALSHLDNETAGTHVLAAEVVARLSTLELGPTPSISGDELQGRRIGQMADVVDSNADNPALVSAVVEYFATLWYLHNRSETGEQERTGSDAQLLLGTLIRMAGYAYPNPRLAATFAVTSDRAVADEERLSLALDQFDSDHDEVRFLAASVVRSSMDRHANRLDVQQLLALLDDSSPAVRWMGAESISTFLSFSPDSGAEIRDRLVLHLEENEAGRAEGAVIRSLAKMDTEQLVAHPTAASAIANYVDEPNQEVSKPAATLLSSLVEASRSIAQQAPVRAAIESGLEHHHSAVRYACLEAVTVLIDDSVGNGRQFVRGLGTNLETEGKHSVLAAVSLAQILDAYPRDGLDVFPELKRGLHNLTPVDNQAVPFIVRGTTVSAVVVEIIADVITLEPGRGELFIDSLVDLATTAEKSTLEGILEILAVLSAEFPAEAKAAVEAAAIGIEGESVSMRRDAAQVLAEIAAYHPEEVEPFADRLVTATDDNSPRVRAPALAVLTNVCAALPDTIEDDIHRVVGCLDDDSATVRTQAAQLVVTVAEREPELIEPAAETADRLRRLQRDPAVDVDSRQLQDASTAIQTGVPSEEAEDAAGHDREEIWSPESGDEMGSSGDTNIFEPVGDDFDMDFANEFDEGDDHDESPQAESDTAEEREAEEPVDEDDAVEEHTTVIQSDNSEDAKAEDVEDHTTVIQPDDQSEAAESEDIEEHTTVIQPDDQTREADEDIEDHTTVIQPEDEAEETEDVEDHTTVIQPSETPEEADENLEEHTTVIQPDDQSEAAEPEDIEEHTTVIQPSETSEETDDVEDHTTVIQPSETREEADEDIEDHTTVIQPDDQTREADEDIEEHTTVIQPDDQSETADTEGVEDHTTVIQPSETSEETDDVEDHTTVIQPDEPEEEESDGDT